MRLRGHTGTHVTTERRPGTNRAWGVAEKEPVQTFPAFPVAILIPRCYGELTKPGASSSGGAMEHSAERRASRRFTMTLPLTVRSTEPSGNEQQGQTRDV